MLLEIIRRYSVEYNSTSGDLCGPVSRSDTIFVEPANAAVSDEHDSVAERMGASGKIDTGTAIACLAND